MTSPESEQPAPLDIEFPFKTRVGDATGASGTVAAANIALERPTMVASTPSRPLPFLADRLLSAPAPFGLEVEIKSEERVVGTWALEINPRDADGTYVSQARADLYVCASARGDPRATGAFLVVRQWWVSMSDPLQLENLYERLSVAALERLDSLTGGVPNPNGESRVCVLFLVDGRRRDRKLFSLDRLQIRLLEDLESEHAVAGVDMRVAHGRGTGTRPHAVFASTLPTPFGADADAGPRPRAEGTQAPASGARIGEVFIRETVSTENLRWNRRASDRARAISESAVGADGLPTAATGDAKVPIRELTSTY